MYPNVMSLWLYEGVRTEGGMEGYREAWREERGWRGRRKFYGKVGHMKVKLNLVIIFREREESER